MSSSYIKRGDILKIYTDGAARGNAGPAAYAFIFVHNDNILHQGFGYIGTKTNNSAEYKAIINALKAAEIAKISLHEFISEMSQLGIPSNLSLENFKKIM